MSVEIRSASELSRAERAELFTASYEGYAIPFQVDEPTLSFIEETFDIDLAASRIAFRDGAPIGLGNLGVRGDDAWVGGVGVVPAARRSGVGEALMRALHDQARERGIRRVWLEVIVENTGAHALYEKLGYGTVRDVQVWSLTVSEDGVEAAFEIPAADAHGRIRELRNTREPWQRDDASLTKYADVRGLATADGAAVFRGSGPIQLLQIAGDAEPLLRTLQRLDTVSVLNLPVEDSASAVLRELGGSIRVRQHEMLLELAH